MSDDEITSTKGKRLIFAAELTNNNGGRNYGQRERDVLEAQADIPFPVRSTPASIEASTSSTHEEGIHQMKHTRDSTRGAPMTLHLHLEK